MNKLYWIVGLLFFVSSYSVYASIGCVDEGAILHCQNEGSISPHTYYDKASGFFQHANTIGAFQDVTYYYGYGRLNNGLPLVYGTEVTPTILKNASDNISYYWADSSYIHTQGNTNFELHKNHSQNLTDGYVHINFSFQSDRRVQGENYFFHGLRNIDVAHDGISDNVTLIMNDGRIIEYDMSRLGDFSGEISQIIIDGGIGLYSYYINFNGNVSFWYNNTNNLTNGDWLFGKYIGTVQANQKYVYSYNWIDANCLYSCNDAMCCTLGLTENGTGQSLVQGEIYHGYTLTLGMVGLTCGAGDVITGSSDCIVKLGQNTTGGLYSTISSTDTDRGLKCINATGCQQLGFTTRNGALAKYTFLVKGSATKGSTTRWEVHKGGGAVTNTYNSTTDSWTTTIGAPLITLGPPANNTETQQDWMVFQANWTGSMACDNMSLKFNTTTNYTTTTLYSNISTNVSLNDDFFFTYWNATCCYSHNCNSGNQGNFTFTIPAPTTTRSHKTLQNTLIDRTEIYFFQKIIRV